MTNKEIMRSALDAHVVSRLRELGFIGRYPHFRRESGNAVDLLSFQTNAWGGSFTVEISAIFPGSAKPNYELRDGKTEQTMTVEYTVKRHRLAGMYNGWFHYWDLYRRRTILHGTEYVSVPEKEARDYVPAKGFQCFQRFDEAQAVTVCAAVNAQLDEAFLWLDQFKKEQMQP